MMKYCDLTLAYTATSGGIRTYIDAKRKFLREEGRDEHVLIIPAEGSSRETDGRLTVVKVASPTIPGCAPYRFFWRPLQLLEILEQEAPDVIELGSFFVCPWTAFRYREKSLEEGRRVFVSAYFHTDIADAYFGAPLRSALHDEVGDWAGPLPKWGLNLATLAEERAEDHFGGIFRKCDLLFAATELQRDRMKEYGVEDAEIVPLGVDLDLFHPEKRSEETRRRYGATRDTVIILYAGRLDREKHPDMLVEAFRKLDLPDARLVLSGEGKMREEFEEISRDLEHFHVAAYETDREKFATLLASADLYATAGPHETFGLSVVEAQASGLPVIGVDAGALRERVVPGTGFLSPPGNAEAMAEDLKRAAEGRENLGENARRHVAEAGYGWEQSFRTLFALYRAHVAARRS